MRFLPKQGPKEYLVSSHCISYQKSHVAGNNKHNITYNDLLKWERKSTIYIMLRNVTVNDDSINISVH